MENGHTRSGKAGHHDHDGHAHAAHASADAAVLKDPVCGMSVTAETPHRFEHMGQRYYFCSAKCRARFAAEPHKYTTLDTAPVIAAAATPVAVPGTIYTCPMHPEIRRDRPGTCPICGMALEPLMPSLDEEESPELVDFRRRFWWTLPLTIIVTVLALSLIHI